MPLARAQDEAHQVLCVCRSQMDFGAEAPLASTPGFGFGPSGRARCLLRGSNEGAIDVMNRPIHLAFGIRWLWHRLNETLPEAGFAPSIEATGHRAPGAITFGQVTPGSAGAQNPQDAVEDASMVQIGSAGSRFLRRK